MTNKIKTYITNARGNSIKELDGRKHLVAPCIAVQEGVLNGELLLKDEIEKFVESWNGIPLPVKHPKQNGNPISANSPDVIERDVVGKFFNAKMEGEKLKGEIWIDIEKCKKVNNNVLTRLMDNKPLEVSTAYFNELEVSEGTFNGQNYSGIQRNLRPDHLALLPDEIGACSWEDGCGAPRINERGDEMSIKDKLLNFINGLDLEYSEKLKVNNEEKKETQKEKLISKLVANSKSIFTEKDKKWLNEKTEDEISSMFPCEEKYLSVNNQELKNTEKKEELENMEGIKNNENLLDKKEEPKKPMTLNEYIEAIPDSDVRAFIANGVQKQKEHKENLIQIITSNSSNEFSIEELKSMETCYLERLEKIISANNSDYSGKGLQGRDSISNNNEKDEIPEPPSVIFSNNNNKDGDK